MTDTEKLKTVPRHSVDGYGRQDICYNDPEGEFVFYSDYEVLIAALEAARADCRENAARIAELESQRKLAFSAGNRWADKCREAERRIAELEARTVKLPSINPQMFNDDVMFGYRKAQREAVEFCAAAGINLETGDEA
ncbi:ead/Ea22-like family protein [Cronobacter dublinensis]